MQRISQTLPSSSHETTNGVARKNKTGSGYAWCLHVLSEGPRIAKYLLEDKKKRRGLLAEDVLVRNRAQSGTFW